MAKASEISPYKIENDIEFVHRRAVRNLIDLLEPGQSVLVADYTDVNRARIYCSELHMKKPSNIKRFSTRSEPGGVRVFRIE
jgi:hypothetical protein